jgi:phospholipid transport system substrate-binding protein
MTFRNWLPLLVLLGVGTGVSAQPYGYGPPPMPHGSAPYPVMPMMPERPAMPARPSAPPAQAESPAPVSRAERPDTIPGGPAGEASATLKAGMDKLLDYLAQKEVPNRLQVAAFLDREIAPYFDFQYMAKWVAGPAYEGMSADAKAAMAAHLEADFLGTLASQLMHYQGQQIRMLPPRTGPRGAVSVNVALLRPQTYPSKLEFRMYRAESGWRVYDVVADGQSAAAYYRVQFRRMAEQGAALGR